MTGLRVIQLKQELRNRKASVCGKKAALIERLLTYDRNANFGQEDINEDEVYSVPGPECFRDINSSSILPQLTKVHIQPFVDRFQAKMKGRQMYESRFLLTARSAVDGNVKLK
ncbi:hypothetical protein K1T71_014976 [Dendrolimus kikuchii]|nr:hypothetical protein K1T71_014976 [Dendrolimus kikuchii]